MSAGIHPSDEGGSKVCHEKDPLLHSSSHAGVMEAPSTPPPRRRVGSAPACSSTRQSKRVYTDRFIPASADASHFEVTTGAENATDANSSPAGQYVKEVAYRKELANTLLGGQPPGKVLSFSPHAPPPPDRKLEELCDLYRHNCSAGLAPKRYRRHIATDAERILDAPKLLDDFYLNLLDWSEGNVLGVALADEVPPILTLTLALNLNLNLALALALTLILALTLALALARSTCGTRRMPRCTSCARRPPTRTSHRSRGRSRRGPRRASWLWARPTTRCSCGTSRSSGRRAACMGTPR